MTEPARQAARELRSLRERRGWSWADEARALKAAAKRLSISPVDRLATASLVRTVARWEREDRPTIPRERYQLLLAYVFARRGEETRVGAGSDFDRLMVLLESWGTRPERRAEIRAQVITCVTSGDSPLAFLPPDLAGRLAHVIADPRALTVEVVNGLAAMVSDVNTQIGTVPCVRLHLALAPAIQAYRALLIPVRATPVKDLVAKAAANAYMIAARLAFETRDDETSHALYGEALRAAAGSPAWERAAIRVSHALITFYSREDVGSAQAIADAAVRDACASDSRSVRARAHALQAELAARAQQDRRAFATLHLAWRDVEGDRTADPAPGSFDPGHLDGFDGVCNVHLRRGAVAEPLLTRSRTALTQPRQLVQRAIVTADLAMARLHMGAPEAAAALLHDCIDATAVAHARVPAQRIAQVRRELRPWRSERFVADLDEHLHDKLLRS
ncbi:hypothetical protein HII36_25805 [Nonomuraea sp. NN258]|uniref:hypothetical protein n=1 Tax=Nonomuraea antri TaxID=2730852 RepID=UPI00156A4F5F|nr:hypothetical protein [Nonomuraea antri]NRQ35214.1 hypothetical protein [Nonomuraea antri]